MNNLKILEIIPTLGGGGAEKMVLDLSEGLQSRGHDVLVVSLYDKAHATDNRISFALNNDIKIRYLNKKAGFDLCTLLELKRLIKIENPDIVHTHLSSFQYVAIIDAFLKIFHVHTMHSIIGNESKVYEKLLINASRKGYTHFVALSESIGDAMKNSYGTDSSNLSCIPNGIDKSIFHRVDRCYSTERVNYIAVGSLIPVKNHELIIRAFAMLQKKRGNVDTLTILGEGNLRNDLERIVCQNNLTEAVFLPGNVDDVFEYLKRADVFVMSSHYEGVSLAMLEAASTALPILSTQTGNTPDVVLNDAILINDDDVIGLANEMFLLAEDLNYRKEYAEKALNIADRFDKSKMVTEYEELYYRFISRI